MALCLGAAGASNLFGVVAIGVLAVILYKLVWPGIGGVQWDEMLLLFALVCLYLLLRAVGASAEGA